MITIIKQYCHIYKSWQKVIFNEFEGAFIIVFLQRKSVIEQIVRITRPAWAGFKTAEEGRTKIM